ncbi:MAG: hypothetical protein ACUVX8_07590 [Candidatus Zipacnadales bacterium]
MKRRELLKVTSLSLAHFTAVRLVETKEPITMHQTRPHKETSAAYVHRLGFGAWINDMRNQALPLQQWPAPQFDGATVEGLLRTLEVMGEAGYQYLDTFGLFAVNDYPPDIVSAFNDPERNRYVAQVFRAAERRGIQLSLPLGLMTWGWDRIIHEDPEVRGKDHEGHPHPHAMCGAKEKSWAYVEKLIDTMFARHNFGAVHLESADLGYCMCPDCAGGQGVIGYNAGLNARAADYIKTRHPQVLVYVCPINWVPWGLNEDGVQHKVPPAELPHIIELSKHIDVFMDQGHRGRMLTWEDARKLQCDYGTSGGLWVYHGARQERCSYFLPYPKRAAVYLRDHYQHGARACLYYQGPMLNPAVEGNSAVAGRIMCDTTRNLREVLEEVIQAYYKPGTVEACAKLAEVFLTAEEAYFGQ